MVQVRLTYTVKLSVMIRLLKVVVHLDPIFVCIYLIVAHIVNQVRETKGMYPILLGYRAWLIPPSFCYSLEFKYLQWGMVQIRGHKLRLNSDTTLRLKVVLSTRLHPILLSSRYSTTRIWYLLCFLYEYFYIPSIHTNMKVIEKQGPPPLKH